MKNIRRVKVICTNKEIENTCSYGKCENCTYCAVQRVGKSYYTNKYGVTGFNYIPIGTPYTFSEVSEKIYNGFYKVV